MNLMSVESIEAALDVVDEKKRSLKGAFDELQSRSHLLSSFDVKWDDLDLYFTELHSELLAQFAVIRESESVHGQKPLRPENVEVLSITLDVPNPARPALKSLCHNMDGLGLLEYVIDRPKDRAAIRAELADAFKHCRDPGSMVLDAIDGFWDENMRSASRFRTTCVLLLEELMRSGLQISPEAKERAISVAADWKVKMAAVDAGDVVEDGEGKEGTKEERGDLDSLGYLQLLATYKLMNEGLSELSELVGCVVSSSTYRQVVDLCRILGMDSKISDVIQRLIGMGKQLLALKFIFGFELTDEFPPVPLLKDYVLDYQKIAQKVRKNGKSSHQSLNDAATREISSLKSVIRCIEDHGLESQYPRDELMARMNMLEKEMAVRKRYASGPATKPRQHVKKPKHNGRKQVKTVGGPSTSKVKLPASIPFPQHLSAQRTLLLSDQAAPYLHSTGGAYVPYAADSAYGLSGTHISFSGNPNLCTSSSQPVYYDASLAAYPGYEYDTQSLQHQVYYPQ